MPSSPTGKNARSRSGFGHILAVFGGLLVLELILDVVLFPADIVLVPVEGVLDAVVAIAMIASALTGGRSGGRRIKSRALGVAVAVAVVLVLVLQSSVMLAPGATGGRPLEIPQTSFPNPLSPSVVPAAPHPASSPSTDPSWANLCAGSAPYTCAPQPTARKGPAVAWDGIDHYVLLSGGGTSSTGGVQNDSWSWADGKWHELASGPTTFVARANASLVDDVVDGYMVLFGGYSGSGAYSAQTWKFVGGTWTLLSPASSPQPSAAACMVYVPFVAGHGGYVLLFGGKGKPGAGASAYYGYTWEFSAGSWTNVTSSVGTSPSARAYSQCTYDSTDGYALLFGGMSSTGTTPLADTWEFNPQASASGQWVSLSPTKSPEARFLGSLTYVTSLAGTYLTCGAAGTMAATIDQGTGYGCTVWQWTAGNWVNVTTTFGFGTGGGGAFPKPGYDAGMTDVPIYSYAFRFGGYTTQTTNVSNAFGNILSVNFGETNGEAAVGTSVKLYANGTYGVGPYTYVWTSLPTGCSSSNSSTIVCFPTVKGSFTGIGAEVVGSDGFNISQTGISLLVDATSSALGNITLGSYVDSPGPGFWGVDLSPQTLNASSMNFLAGLINQTPFRTLRYGTNGDGQNISNLTLGSLGVQYSQGGVASESTINYTLFKTFCAWLHCTSIITLPAESNDPGLIAQTVNRVETVYNLHPTYWNIGNEPTAWNHFNIAETKWLSSDNVAPTSTQYALMVQNDTRAILSVDPNAKIIGLTDASTGGASPPFSASTFQAIAADSGADLAGADFHTYSAVGEAVKVPSAALSHANDVAAAGLYESYDAGLVAGCASCNLSLSVGEYNTGAGANVFPETYVSGVGAALNGAQLLSLGASMFSYYDLIGNSGLDLVNATTNVPFPAFAVYTAVLKHLPMKQIYNATISTTERNIWAVEGVNGSTAGILVVNANTSVGLALTSSANFGTDSLTVYSISPAGIQATGVYSSLPKSLYVPPEGVMLLLYTPTPVSIIPPATVTTPTASSAAVVTPGIVVAVVAVAVVLVFSVLLLTVFTHPRGRSGRRVGR